MIKISSSHILYYQKISRGSQNYLVHYIHRDNVCLGKNVPVFRLLEAASRCIEILSYLFHLLGSQNEHLHTYLNIQYKIIGPLCLDYKWLKGQFFLHQILYKRVNHANGRFPYICMYDALPLFSVQQTITSYLFNPKACTNLFKKNGTYYFIRHQCVGTYLPSLKVYYKIFIFSNLEQSAERVCNFFVIRP